jgi:hypothetical protein
MPSALRWPADRPAAVGRGNRAKTSSHASHRQRTAPRRSPKASCGEMNPVFRLQRCSHPRRKHWTQKWKSVFGSDVLGQGSVSEAPQCRELVRKAHGQGRIASRLAHFSTPSPRPFASVSICICAFLPLAFRNRQMAASVYMQQNHGFSGT